MTPATPTPEPTALAGGAGAFPDGHLLTHSAEQTFKTCPRKFYLAYRLGLRPDHHSDALRMGAAYHAGLEQLKHGNGEAIAEEVVREMYAEAPCPPWLQPDEYDVECETAVALVRGYHRRYRDDAIVEYVAVELSFKMPIVNPATGGETPLFRSAGKIDAIVRLPDGRLAIEEEKTTSEAIDPGSDYWRRLLLDAQISRYFLAAQQLGYPVETVIYKATRKPSIRPKALSKADRQQATSTGVYFGLAMNAAAPDRETPKMYGARLLHDLVTRPEFYFARNEIPRLASDLDDFRAEQWQIQRTIRIAETEGRFYRNTGACTFPYRCPYLDICRGLSGDPNEETPAGFRRVHRLHEELVGTEERTDQ